jgi:hypothetical protein
MKYSEEYVISLLNQIDDLKYDIHQIKKNHIIEICAINWGIGITIEETLRKLHRMDLYNYIMKTDNITFKAYPIGHQLAFLPT